MIYVTIGVKLAVGFLCLLLYLNISGRAQLAPNSAADQIGNYVLGGIIGGVIYNTDISILEMVIVIAIWSALILSMRLLKSRNRAAKVLIDGRSLLLFDDGQLRTDNLRLAGKNARDFIAAMHQRGIHRLDELQSVWLETNGQYTILKKGETPFPIALVEDGQVAKEGLERIGQTGAWLEDELKKQGVEAVDRVAYAEWVAAGKDGHGRLSVYPYLQG